MILRVISILPVLRSFLLLPIVPVFFVFLVLLIILSMPAVTVPVSAGPRPEWCPETYSSGLSLDIFLVLLWDHLKVLEEGFSHDILLIPALPVGNAVD